MKEIIHYLDSKKDLQAFLPRLEKSGYKVFKKGNLQASRIFPDVDKRAHVLIQKRQDGYDVSVHIDINYVGVHKVLEDDKLLKIISQHIFWGKGELKSMRILTFYTLWEKFKKDEFTTYRFTRKDKDWQISEFVKIVYKQRSKTERRELGIAEIIVKEPRWILKDVTEVEAKKDGFQSISDMVNFFQKSYGDRIEKEPMNKLTLRWTERWL